MKPIPLFERFPVLAERVPWTPIVNSPTPINDLPALSQHYGLTSLSIKWEDRTHPVIGGNKVRGLEFLLGDALQQKADSLITFGAAGSNHVAATAYHARALGMDTTALVISQPSAPYVARNLFDEMASGARLIPVNPITALPKFLHEWLRQRRRGRRVRMIPPGGTTSMSCLGHVNAALELRSQIDAGLLPSPDYIFVGLGSLGTAAGVLLGCRLAGLSTRIAGVVVFNRWYCTAGRCAALARRTLHFMRERDPSVPDIEITRSDFEVISNALGRGYAHATIEATELTRQLSGWSAMTLDQSYTSKALAGALAWIESRRQQSRNLLFWHTYHHRSPLSEEETNALAARLPQSLRKYLVWP